jgi:putative Holliday junction resolvase
MRIMAIDYGDVRTGIAISDPTGLLAGFAETITERRAEALAEEICRPPGSTMRRSWYSVTRGT